MLKTYSISKNPAHTLFNIFDLRKAFIKYYISACIYYLIQSPTLKSWLFNEVITEQLDTYKKDYVDVDPIFSAQHDADYDSNANGVSISAFFKVYGKWIDYCLKETNE